LGLILALSARLTVLENTVGASDGRQKLCFRSEQPLSLLRAVRNHESLARCRLILHLHAVGHFHFLLVLQLGERRRLLVLVEVRIRRILICLLLFGNNWFYEGGVPLLRYDTHLVVLTTDRGLLTLRAFLEMEKWWVLQQGVRPIVLVAHRLALVYLLVLMVEVRLRGPKTLLMNNALLIIVELAVRDFVEGISVVLRISFAELVIIDLRDVPVHLIYEHTGQICFYQ